MVIVVNEKIFEMNCGWGKVGLEEFKDPRDDMTLKMYGGTIDSAKMDDKDNFLTKGGALKQKSTE